MQMYAGLPIITNKITLEECRGVKHHLMDFLGPEQVFRVGKFVREATRTVSCAKYAELLPVRG
jgi:tRNA dimethylallyltransferase